MDANSSIVRSRTDEQMIVYSPYMNNFPSFIPLHLIFVLFIRSLSRIRNDHIGMTSPIYVNVACIASIKAEYQGNMITCGMQKPMRMCDIAHTQRHKGSKRVNNTIPSQRYYTTERKYQICVFSSPPPPSLCLHALFTETYFIYATEQKLFSIIILPQICRLLLYIIKF